MHIFPNPVTYIVHVDLHYSDATLIKKLVANEQLKLSGPNKNSFVWLYTYMMSSMSYMITHFRLLILGWHEMFVMILIIIITRGGKIPIKWTAPEV